MIRTIVVPLDGSALAEAALPHARGLAAESGAVVVLVRAVHGWDTPGGKVAAIEQAKVYLRQVQSCPALGDVTVHTDVVTDHPTAAIVRVATQRDADLIVLGAHDRSGLGLILHGSVASAVLRGTTVPVLLVPPVRRPHVHAGIYRTVGESTARPPEDRRARRPGAPMCQPGAAPLPRRCRGPDAVNSPAHGPS